MSQFTNRKIAGVVALVGSLMIAVSPLAYGLYGGTAFVAYLLGLAGLAMAAKANWWPASYDYLFLVGVGALTIVAAFATGGTTLWVLLGGGGAIIGAGLWRRFMTEPAGNTQTSPS